MSLTGGGEDLEKTNGGNFVSDRYLDFAAGRRIEWGTKPLPVRLEIPRDGALQSTSGIYDDRRRHPISSGLHRFRGSADRISAPGARGERESRCTLAAAGSRSANRQEIDRKRLALQAQIASLQAESAALAEEAEQAIREEQEREEELKRRPQQHGEEPRLQIGNRPRVGKTPGMSNR